MKITLGAFSGFDTFPELLNKTVCRLVDVHLMMSVIIIFWDLFMQSWEKVATYGGGVGGVIGGASSDVATHSTIATA